MFIKRRTRTKDGKTHIYYSVCESLRVSRDRVVQRQVLHLGELNTTQLDSWQHSIDVLHEDGQRRQLRLFTDREQAAPNALDVVQGCLFCLRPGALWNLLCARQPCQTTGQLYLDSSAANRSTTWSAKPSSRNTSSNVCSARCI